MQWWHHECQQRRRDHADAGKAPLAKAEEKHGWNGEKIKEWIGDHGGIRNEPEKSALT